MNPVLALKIGFFPLKEGSHIPGMDRILLSSQKKFYLQGREFIINFLRKV
jgi:hypothetical protein